MILRRAVDQFPRSVSGFLGPAQPATHRAPGAVRAAVSLLCALAGLMVVGVAGTTWDLATWNTYVDRAAASVSATAAQVAAEKSGNTTTDVALLVVAVVLAALFLVSALLCRRGVRAGRIIAFAGVAPLAVCCLMPFVPAGTSALQDAAAKQQPAVMSILGLVPALAPFPVGIAVLALLLTAPAGAFFSGMPPAPPGYGYVRATPWPAGFSVGLAFSAAWAPRPTDPGRDGESKPGPSSDEPPPDGSKDNRGD